MVVLPYLLLLNIDEGKSSDLSLRVLFPWRGVDAESSRVTIFPLVRLVLVIDNQSRSLSQHRKKLKKKQTMVICHLFCVALVRWKLIGKVPMKAGGGWG